ncbi:MAG: hypothetical protein IJM84_03770 [Bacteroidaceae bacterium]|nr:hypothetical protein [Bacteroidaceae bacterium]MBQ7664581.1 hypothetical protein [Bacteroidaceae bacterium]
MKTYIAPQMRVHELSTESMLMLSKTEDLSDGSGALSRKKELQVDIEYTGIEENYNTKNYWE